MSTQADLDLQQRLSQLPVFAPTDSGSVINTNTGFGDIISDLQAILQQAPQYLNTAATILPKIQPYLPTIEQAADDPALPALIDRVQTLQKLDAAKSAPAAPGTPAPAQAGVGLKRVLPLWDAAIWYTKYPWAPWAIAAGTVVALGGIGFGIGRWTKRCKTSTVGVRYRRR